MAGSLFGACVNHSRFEARFYFDCAEKRIIEMPEPGQKLPCVLVNVSGPEPEVTAMLELIRASVAAMSERLH